MPLSEYIPLNFGLLKQPLNWIIVLLMVILAGFVIDAIISYYNSLNTKAE